MTNKETAKLFRRLADSASSGGVFVPHLEAALLAKGEKVWPEEYAIKLYNKERVWDGYFHPSSHTMAPELQLYYEFHPDYRVRREAPSRDLIMTFQVGSAYHALLQSMFIHLGFTTEDEVEVHFTNDERWVSGTVDVRKIFLPNGKTYPVEIKSAGYIPKEPPIYYINQFQIYMDVGCEEPQEEGILLYLEKSNPHRFKEFIIRRDEKVLEAVYSKWDRVREAIEFSDPSMLEFPCHEFNSKAHVECPARNVCVLGPPNANLPKMR